MSTCETFFVASIYAFKNVLSCSCSERSLSDRNSEETNKSVSIGGYISVVYNSLRVLLLICKSEANYRKDETLETGLDIPLLLLGKILPQGDV